MQHLHGNFYAESTQRPVNSAYLAQVSDISPEDLLGRDDDIEVLEEFCRGNAPYLWWRAGPWAGKTALLSWFTLHPPPEVDIICFFVTRRLASQANHVAFTEILIEQLSELLGLQLPSSPAPAARDGYRRHLLNMASELSQSRGRTLVLVVDGLDEDQGKPSIASLLPRLIPTSLKVVVASRPDPTIPHDVVGDHPLRLCTTRELISSPYAQYIRISAEDELQSLLSSQDEGTRTLLGLVAAALGGLTKEDLSSLTSLAPYRINELLGRIAGRSFVGRQIQISWTSFETVYLFAHDALQSQAETLLGESEIESYRAIIHEWSHRYQKENWPEGTPYYLLRGYPQMLEAIKDAELLSSIATDRNRHDRMLETTGGDANALNEIQAAEALMLQEAKPNLYVMVKLELHKTMLRQRNTSISPELPAVLAYFGHTLRAEAMANVLPNRRERVEALAEIACVLAARGELSNAQQIIAQSELIIKSIPLIWDRSLAMVLLARSAAEAQDTERARHLTERAIKLSTAIKPEMAPLRNEIYSVAAFVFVILGDATRASLMASRAHKIAQSINANPYLKTIAICGASRAFAGAKNYNMAARTIMEAEWTYKATVMQASLRGSRRDDTRAGLAAIMARTLLVGGLDKRAREFTREALDIAESYDDHWDQGAAIELIRLAGTYSSVDAEMAREVATSAEVAASRSFYGSDPEVYPALARTLIRMGDTDRAIEIASAAESSAHVQEEEWTSGFIDIIEIAKALAGAGRSTEACDLAMRALTDVRDNEIESLNDDWYFIERTIPIVEVYLEAGRQSDAASIVRSWNFDIADRFGSEILASIANLLAATGRLNNAGELARTIMLDLIVDLEIVDTYRAVGLAEMSLTIARRLTEVSLREASQAAVDYAVKIANKFESIDFSDVWINTFAQAAEMYATIDDKKSALRAAKRVGNSANSMSSRDRRAIALAVAAGALARIGHTENAVALGVRAESEALMIVSDSQRCLALSLIVNMWVKIGDVGRASHAAAKAESSVLSIVSDSDRAVRLIDIARSWNNCAQDGRARKLLAYAWTLDEIRGIDLLACMDPDALCALIDDVELERIDEW